MNGCMIVSLDFEMMWGVHADETFESYGNYVLADFKAVPKMLDLFNKYHIHATWATVGMIFCNSKSDLEKYSPDIKPNYTNANDSTYNFFDTVSDNADTDKYHFGKELIEKIRSTDNQEIGSHTYSHYYCEQPGQTLADFERDLQSYQKLAKDNNLEIKSLVFPKNQACNDYIELAKKYGITSCRTLENNWINKISNYPIKRILRIIDSYFNISGNCCYTYDSVREQGAPYKLKSSSFYRTYRKDLKIFEFLKILRVKTQMNYAAKHGKIFHVWWHPHNLGEDVEKSIYYLEKLFKYYKYLDKKYGFDSLNMSEVAEIIDKLK